MLEDPIQSLLRGITPFRVPTPAGMVAYSRSSIEKAGGDPDAVAEWTVGHGGYIGDTHGSGWLWRYVPGDIFYAVPLRALGHQPSGGR